MSDSVRMRKIAFAGCCSVDDRQCCESCRSRLGAIESYALSLRHTPVAENVRDSRWEARTVKDGCHGPYRVLIGFAPGDASISDALEDGERVSCYRHDDGRVVVERRCHTCRWVSVGGTCHKRSPVDVDETGHACWPKVGTHYVCGDWEACDA